MTSSSPSLLSLKPIPSVIYMTGIPKLKPSQRESRESCIYKTLHWIRHKRHCLNIIHSDILDVSRVCVQGPDPDILKLHLKSRHLTEGLLALEHRSPLIGDNQIQFRSTIFNLPLAQAHVNKDLFVAN